MKIKVAILIAIEIAIAFKSLCQYNNVWMLSDTYGPGYSLYGINFNNGIPDTFSIYRPMYFFNTNSSLCDTSGNMLMYSNGVFIANSVNDTLSNSTNFNPGYLTSLNFDGLGSIQPIVFLPYPGHSNQYIVFHESAEFIDVPLPGGGIYHKVAPLMLRYSIIDMSLNGGLGGIIPNKKSIVLINDTLTLGKLNACKHGNGRDWWVLTQRYNDSLFYKILITPDTIQVTTQQIGSAYIYDIYGQSVFSPDGSKYVMMMYDLVIDIFDFDRCDGTLYNYHHMINLPDTFYGYYGASISPNNRFLYVNTPIKIYQYDFTSSNIDSAVQTVAVLDSFVNPFLGKFFLNSLGPDGKIYISTYDATLMLHVINQPDSFGLSSDVQQHAVTLPGPGGNFSVPTFPNYNLGPLTGSICDTLTGINDIPQKENVSLTITPNPVTDGVLHIRYMLPQNKAGTLSVTDITGKQVYTYRLPQWSTLQNLPLQLAEGMYFCTVTSNGLKVSKKFVVIR